MGHFWFTLKGPVLRLRCSGFPIKPRDPERLTSQMAGKVEIFLEQREVAFLSPSKICENLNFSTKIISTLTFYFMLKATESQNVFLIWSQLQKKSTDIDFVDSLEDGTILKTKKKRNTSEI